MNYHSHVAFILLINVKMSFNINGQDKYHSVKHEKSLITSRSGFHVNRAIFVIIIL